MPPVQAMPPTPTDLHSAFVAATIPRHDGASGRMPATASAATGSVPRSPPSVVDMAAQHVPVSAPAAATHVQAQKAPPAPDEYDSGHHVPPRRAASPAANRLQRTPPSPAPYSLAERDALLDQLHQTQQLCEEIQSNLVAAEQRGHSVRAELHDTRVRAGAAQARLEAEKHALQAELDKVGEPAVQRARTVTALPSRSYGMGLNR